MSDFDTFKTTYPNSTLETILVDGNKYWKASNGPTNFINLYDFDTGAKFGDFNTTNGIFNGKNSTNDVYSEYYIYLLIDPFLTSRDEIDKLFDDLNNDNILNVIDIVSLINIILEVE